MEKNFTTDTSDYPSHIDYDCGCVYKITDIKGVGSFMTELENLCEEHDFTVYGEDDN